MAEDYPEDYQSYEVEPENTPIFKPNGDQPEEPSFWKRNGATVITLAILGLIIGGAIAVNERRTNDTEVALDTEEVIEPSEESGTSEEENVVDQTPEVVIAPPATETQGEVGSGTSTDSTTVTTAGDDNVVITSGNPDTFTVTAMSGEGRTHLARRAITEQLKRADIDLSDEQRVYAEDYLQKNFAPSNPLHEGSTLTFNDDQISEAITGSQNLTSVQLDNLHQYSVLVNWPPI